MNPSPAILEFDLGNTSVKWRLLDAAGTRQGGGRLEGITDAALSLLAAELPPLARVRVASVVAEGSERVLADWARSSFGLRAEFARTTASCCGLRNSYEDPSRMGADRWLAMLAAYREAAGPVLVIDIGSALKLDFVSENGEHLGGYIVPGLGLMQRALVAGTDRVRFSEADAGDWRQPGRSTAEAVCRGAALASSGAVMAALQVADAQLPAGYAVFLAGGDADQLSDVLVPVSQQRLFCRPELVMDGLALTLP